MTKEVNVHFMDNFIYITDDSEIKEGDYTLDFFTKKIFKINSVLPGYYKTYPFAGKKIIATNNSEYKDLFSIPLDWCNKIINDYSNIPKTINIEIYESYSDGEDYQLYDYKLKDNCIIIVEKEKQETWQDILNEYKKYKLLGGYMEEFYWLIENFEVPKRK